MTDTFIVTVVIPTGNFHAGQSGMAVILTPTGKVESRSIREDRLPDLSTGLDAVHNFVRMMLSAMYPARRPAHGSFIRHEVDADNGHIFVVDVDYDPIPDPRKG